MGTNDDPLLTINQLSARWSVPVAGIYQMNHAGRAPRRIRIGRTVRYRLSDVIAWENSRAIEGSAVSA